MRITEHFHLVHYAQFCETVAEIRAAHASATYDHRLTQPHVTLKQDGGAYGSQAFVHKYAGFKWAVAHVLRPPRILELGVGSGIAAFAFLDAMPTAQYVGIDNGLKDRAEGFRYLDHVAKTAAALKRAVTLRRENTRALSEFPRVDLLHVDAGHGYTDVLHDTRTALESGSAWILCDDCRYGEVASAVMTALRETNGHRHWAYFEDTWTGNILIRNEDVS